MTTIYSLGSFNEVANATGPDLNQFATCGGNRESQSGTSGAAAISTRCIKASSLELEYQPIDFIPSLRATFFFDMIYFLSSPARHKNSGFQISHIFLICSSEWNIFKFKMQLVYFHCFGAHEIYKIIILIICASPPSSTSAHNGDPTFKVDIETSARELSSSRFRASVQNFAARRAAYQDTSSPDSAEPGRAWVGQAVLAAPKRSAIYSLYMNCKFHFLKISRLEISALNELAAYVAYRNLVNRINK